MLHAKKNSVSYLAGLSIPIIVVCAILEFGYPEQFFSGYGFIVAVILTYFANRRIFPIIIAGISALVIVSSLLFTGSFSDLFSILNQVSALLGVLMTLYFVLYISTVEIQKDTNNKQVSSLINYATEGIILTNQRGTIILANPHAQELFGYNEAELIGNQIEMLLPDAIRPRHVDHVKHFHQAPSNRSMGAGRDLFAKRKDNSVFPVEISLSHYTSGNEAFVIAFIIDITIRKQSEQILKEQTLELQSVTRKVTQLNTELEQKVQDRTTMLRETLAQLERNKNELAESLEKEKELGDLKSRFVSTVSHEFRTPLSTILSSAALIGRYLKDDEQDKRDRHIARIKEQVKHMNTLLEDLLLLGKLEEGLTELKPETFNLADFITDLVSEMQEIAKTGQQILVHPFEIDDFITDKRLLKNILINLISNAIKFSPESSIIHITLSINQQLLSIAVKDSGIGIPDEDRQHLFERFFRARGAHNIPGTGLGLHIVSRYLEIMKGSIELQSEAEVGSTFTIHIPLQPIEPTQNETHTTD